MKYLIVFLLAGFLLSCGNKNNKDTEIKNTSDSVISESPATYDTLYLTDNVAVFWWPDSVDQIVMKENYDEISYNKFVDDLTWYTSRASESLDSSGINTRITDSDVIVFTSPDKPVIRLNRKEVKGNMVLFHVNKDPLVTSISDFNRNEVLEYFR